MAMPSVTSSNCAVIPPPSRHIQVTLDIIRIILTSGSQEAGDEAIQWRRRALDAHQYQTMGRAVF